MDLSGLWFQHSISENECNLQVMDMPGDVWFCLYCRFHTLEDGYRTDDLLQLETSYGKFDTMYDGYSIRVLINNQVNR